MSDIRIKIQHAKRSNARELDLSNCNLSDIPIDITKLTMLESLNISNNKLLSLKRVEQLPNLKQINASNNQINSLHPELQDMLSLDTIILVGNPIVNNCPVLAKIENNYQQLRKAFSSYFGSSPTGGLSTLSNFPSNNSQICSSMGGPGSMYGGSVSGSSNMGGVHKAHSQQPHGHQQQNLGGQSQPAAFLAQDKNMNDPATLRKMIADLELENKKLKEGQGGSFQDFSKSMKETPSTTYTGRGPNIQHEEKKSWMSFGGARPTTASQNQGEQVRDLNESLKNERRQNKKLQDEIEGLHRELQKSNFSAFTHGAGQISTSAGRLPQVPGVREIQEGDLEIQEKIAGGGFSVIHKGVLNGTPVAVKKIVDPRVTEELLNEIYNEIVMQSILRHPNIALLMGVIPQIPNIVIVFEYVTPGSLYNLLHIKKQQFNLTLEQRLKIARDVALVYHYMHSLGIVHRDLKSHNILIDDNLTVKVCDFGLARFKADLNKGTMQYSGTPAYMSPELFQKRQYDESVDTFAFGALLWELVTREVPYDGLDPADIRAKVEKEEPLKTPYGTDQRLVALINECRQVNFQNRPKFDKILFILNQFVKDK